MTLSKLTLAVEGAYYRTELNLNHIENSNTACLCPGYRMMSVTHPDLCRRVALRYSAACIGICSAAPILGLTSWAFAVDSLILNLYFTFLAYRSTHNFFVIA
jgi:hypothetical protein